MSTHFSAFFKHTKIPYSISVQLLEGAPSEILFNEQILRLCSNRTHEKAMERTTRSFYAARSCALIAVCRVLCELILLPLFFEEALSSL